MQRNPPVVTLISPNPTTAEQILSGTIPISWTATDTEDVQSTLDISADYSTDGGATWTSIFSGTNNNAPPYNWVTTGLNDGTGYKIRVMATDSGGTKSHYATSIEAFTIENIINDEWYFQVDKAGTYNDLTVKPVENIPNLAATASINLAGEYKVGTWQTVQTFTGSNINGPWSFKTYGKTPNSGLVTLQGILYAKVFTSSNMATPLDTTVYDDENVGSFTTSHLFTWTDTLAGTVTDGNTVVIEIWLHVTGGPYTQNSGTTTNPGFDTTATPWTYFDWEDSGPGTATGSWVGAGGNPGGFVQIACAPESTGPGGVSYAYSGLYQQSFTTTFAPFQSTLELDWKVIVSSATDPATQTFYAFVETTSGVPSTAPVWKMDTTASAPTSWVSVDIDVSGIVTAATTYYVKVAYRHDSLNKGEPTYTGGFDNVLLTYARPYSIFYMEYDYGTTKSNVVPTINSGPSPDPYEITLTGKTANSWVFISFPSGVTGNIQDLLTDGGATGDGLTTWSVAKWYNPQTPNDPWKTYRVGGTANDMPSITNGMGFWIYLTANSGDQMLTLASYVATPASTLITLYAGWNLVGYPSATDRLGSTLPSQVDIMSVYSASATYTDYVGAAIDPVTLHHGNAYFMHCSAGTTWTVTNP